MPEMAEGAGVLASVDARASGETALILDIEGFEGPLDLLLLLARQHRIDLQRISILALAEQYLSFIQNARTMRIELAADYLLMAAWLAYLKSRMLLPDDKPDDEPSAGELAEDLAFRLRRLEQVRAAGAALIARPQLGRDVFARGQPEGIFSSTTPLWTATFIDLLKAYAGERQKHALARVTLRQRRVWSLDEARAAMEKLAGHTLDWMALDRFITEFLTDPAQRATALASSFSAALELAREGKLEMRQEGPFRPLWLRGLEPEAAS